MKSSLKNMVLCLGVITLVSAAVLGVSYKVTEEPIEVAKKNKITQALANVMESFDNIPADEMQQMQVDGITVKVYTGRSGSEVSGYAVETMTKAGFGGEIKMMVGFTVGGEVYNIEVLEQSETPGLGSKMSEPENPLLLSFRGRNPAQMNMKVSKDGGDVDAITASTISSRAYIEAVARAYQAYTEIKNQGGESYE